MPQNILIIMSDEHLPDISGAYGDARAHTPNLDRLAKEGIRFDQAYCNNPMCVPSRLSFLTGRTTQEIEVWSLSDTVRSDEVTWPVALGAAGYETVISGRMHCWWPDKLHGFQKRLCGDTHTRVCMATYELYEPGPAREAQGEVLRDIWLKSPREGEVGEGDNPGWIDDREATDCAKDYIREASPELPWALCVGYFCPHSPLRFPAEYFDRYRDMPVVLEELDETLPPFMQAFVQTMGVDIPFPEEHQRNAIRAYYAMVHYVDDLIGELIETLEATGQLDNTIVIYTSDHGEMLGRRGLWYKNQLLEPSIRTPMIVRAPGGLRGKVDDSVVSLLDLYPTFCEIAGAEPWPEIQGDSLVPRFTGEGDDIFADRSVFIEYADYGIGQPSACIRRRNLKLIAARDFEPVLYDLARDPGETQNVYGDPAYADDIRQLEADLAEHWDPEDTWRRVIRNQQRTVFNRDSLVAHADREGRTV